MLVLDWYGQRGLADGLGTGSWIVERKTGGREGEDTEAAGARGLPCTSVYG